MAAYYKVDVSLSTNSVTVGAPSAQEVLVTLPLIGPAGAVGATGATGANGQGVPVGGTTGQVLRKASGTNYDTEWAAAASGSGSVTSVALAGTGLSISGSPVTTSGTITANVSYGTTAGTAAQGNDSRFVTASTTTPAALGTAAVGTGTTFARADHVHAMPTAAAVGAAQAVTDIELTPDGTTTVTTAQLPARGIAFSDGEATFTVNLPTPGIRQSGLTFSIKSEYEAGSGPNFVTVVHAAVNLLTSVELDEDEGSIDFLWDGYAWTYSSTSRLRSYPNRVLQLPSASGTIARTEDFAAPPAIGNTTPNTGAFTTLTANNGTLTASAPVLNLAQTWNNAAVTFTGLRFNVTNTASAADSLYESVQLAGNQFYELEASRAVRLYNTSSSANANFERGFMRWSSNVFQIGTDKGGTGSARALALQTNGSSRWVIDTTGRLVSQVFGPGSGIFAHYTGGFNITATSGGTDAIARFYADNGHTRISTTETSLVLEIARLTFNGTTNAFPALKRSSTTLQVRLADDTAFAPFACAGLTLNGDLTASTRNIVTDITTGTKIGTATTQKLGFFNNTPVVQPTAVADATDAATVITQLNALLSRMRDLGLIAT